MHENAQKMWYDYCTWTIAKVKINYCNNERLLRCVAPPIGWGGHPLFFFGPGKI